MASDVDPTRKEGEQAFHEGLSLDDNPYLPQSLKRRA